MDSLFDQVHAALRGDENRRHWHDAACPFCGKEPKRGQIHFSYNETGYRCFVCGAHGGLFTLAEHLRLNPAPETRHERLEPRPVQIARWRTNPAELLRRYRTSDRYAAWRAYKPLTAATVDRFDFGIGRLPFQNDAGEWYLSKSNWLTVSLWEGGTLVGLRGRNRGDRGPKWISATGTSYTLWGADYVRPGSVTWLCENYVDAAWLMQQHPEWSACAIGGATTWQASWVELLAARRPQVVIVALDNDLPGQATGWLRTRLENEWRVEHPLLEPPAANGPRIANALLAAGVNAVLFDWPAVAPVKAGIDWILQQREKVAA